MNDILQRIDHNIKFQPLKIAIEQGNKKISYAELGRTVGQYTNVLMNLGSEHQIFIVMMNRSPEFISTILAIMKLGKVFVLLDPDYPVQRNLAVINQIKSNLIVSNSFYRNNVKEFLETSGIYKEIIEINQYVSNKQPGFIRNSEQAYKHCYSFFTSGSTGAPKGVIGNYEGLNHFVNWQLNEFQIGSDCRVGQLTSPAFDPFLRDVFLPLCSGGTLVIPETSKLILNLIELLEWLNQKKITIIHTVPTIFKLMIAAVERPVFQSLQFIFLAGEMVKGRDLSKYYSLSENKASLINLYGPTETTLAKFHYQITQEDINRKNIPVGIPITGTAFFVFNENNEQCGVNEAGEVYIKPPFEMGGYMNSEYSAGKFIHSAAMGQVFRTGDLGMILPDGNLQLMGRMDKEIKINGVRIDTAEIEAEIISQLPDCKDIVIEAIENSLGIKTLCAFIQTSHDIPALQLNEHLKVKLPHYMIPAKYYLIDQFQHLPNGKIDRMHLVNGAQMDLDYISKNNPAALLDGEQNVLQELSQIWSHLLFKDSIQLTDDFFDLGGHSLTLINLIAEIYKQFKVEIPIDYVFENPAFFQILNYINEAVKDSSPALTPMPQQETFELSSSQKRMYILNLFEDIGITYNSPLLLKVNPSVLDLPRLERAIKEIVNRHEILRTTFHLENSTPIQKVHDQVRVEVVQAEINDVEKNLKSQMNAFDLSSLPLFKVKILSTKTDVYLFFDFHHIIIDGTSKKIFIQQLNWLYAGNKLADPAVQYRDFLAWQNQLFVKEEMTLQKEYWLHKLQGSKFNIQIPTDFPKTETQSFAGDRYFFSVNDELLIKLKSIEAQEKVTLFMILFAAYSMFVLRLTREDEAMIGMPIDNRRLQEFQQTLGLITNTIVIKSVITSESTYKEFLLNTKRNIIQALKNQDYPFEMLVNDLKIKRDPINNPIFNTLFVHQHVDVSMKSDLIIKNCNVNYEHSRFDLLLQAFTDGNSLQFCFEYRSDLFRTSTIEMFAESYLDILNRLCSIDSEIAPEKEIECD